MAVIPDIITCYVLVIRGDIKILATILSHKVLYYTRMCSKCMVIKSV